MPTLYRGRLDSKFALLGAGLAFATIVLLIVVSTGAGIWVLDHTLLKWAGVVKGTLKFRNALLVGLALEAFVGYIVARFKQAIN